MSYRCQKCERAYPNADHPEGYSPNRIVTKVRRRGEFSGVEIAEEKNLCKRCAATQGEPTMAASVKQSQPDTSSN